MDMAGIIRAKRRGKDMTQEELAELLGVSTSAVSLWESGKTMPDIATVPAICAVLEVSADELLGIDRERREAEVDAIVAEARKSGNRGYTREALEMIEAGLKEFPESWKLMYHAMHYHYNSFISDHGREVHRDKAIEIGERILAKCTEQGLRSSATQKLCFLYSELNPARAEELLSKMEFIYCSRDVLAVNTLKGDKKLEAIHHLTTVTMDLLTMEMTTNSKLDSGEYRFSRDEHAKMQEKVLTIFNTIFEDGDCGFYHCRMYNAEDFLADYYADAKDEKIALLHLERAAFHAVEFVKFAKVGENGITNTSLALRGHKSGSFSTTSPRNDAQALVDSMKLARWDFVRETPEFAAIASKLAPYAGDWAKRE